MLTGMSKDILGLFSPLPSDSRSREAKGRSSHMTFPWVGVYLPQTVKDSDPSIHSILCYPAFPDVENVAQQKALTAP
ncbi:hypothetical protein CVT25_002712 [Psilocybe cyanescens]|uniref:Uncharacterized protein n=1 Tax=Psilocybe cyanescens TaxID=93625 RepID=A0A409WLK9_PSICY|nr:hypothetical protein CVT25_002712 [Psilocybe cyanescens]